MILLLSHAFSLNLPVVSLAFLSFQHYHERRIEGTLGYRILANFIGVKKPTVFMIAGRVAF